MVLSHGQVIDGVRRTCRVMGGRGCRFNAFVSNPSGATSVRRTLIVKTRKTESMLIVLGWYADAPYKVVCHLLVTQPVNRLTC